MDASLSIFRAFPTELRWYIWDLALYTESQERIVPALKGQPDVEGTEMSVQPSQHLISPLLLATRESRYCALSFYSSPLTVYEIQPDLTHRPRGTLHLSAKNDTFLIACAPHFLEFNTDIRADLQEISSPAKSIPRLAKKVFPVIEYDKGALNTVVDTRDYDNHTMAFTELQNLTGPNRRLVLLVRDQSCSGLWSILHKKGRAGFDAFMNLFEYDCSFARLDEDLDDKEIAPPGPSVIRAGPYELITTAEWVNEMRSRAPVIVGE